ncbi:MAG: 30S ribosomal protein S3 [Candidatus Diapherotrites archaeon]
MIERIFIQQGLKKVELEKYLKKELEKAGFTRLETMKTPLVTRIIISVTNPGLAIGKGGTNIRKLTKDIEEKFKIDNPQIEIKEITVPELDAQAMADRIAELIGRGFSWRSVAYKTVKDISRAGAPGVEILLAGALSGKGQRKRKVRIYEGYMKKVGEQARYVDYGAAPARAKFGIIGVKVKIVKPGTIFTDKIKIEEEKEETKEKEIKEEEKEVVAAEPEVKEEVFEEKAEKKDATKEKKKRQHEESKEEKEKEKLKEAELEEEKKEEEKEVE